MTMKKSKPSWLKFSEKEVEAIVLKLSKQGLSPEKIGLVLRDQYGIPSTKVFGKKIGHILEKAGIDANSEIINLTKRIENLKKHMKKNKQDKIVKRKIVELTSRVRKLKKYLEKRGKNVK